MIRIFSLLLGSLLVFGCATTPDDVIPKGNPTVQEQYSNFMSGANSDTKRYRTWNNRQLKDRYTREAANELDNMFPYVPNPTIYLFVDPHITKNGLPVPGYTTKFKLYDKEHFALPGETIQ